MAEVEGDVERAEELGQELGDLEDRANELDRIRTSNVSLVE